MAKQILHKQELTTTGKKVTLNLVVLYQAYFSNNSKRNPSHAQQNKKMVNGIHYFLSYQHNPVLLRSTRALGHYTRNVDKTTET